MSYEFAMNFQIVRMLAFGNETKNGHLDLKADSYMRYEHHRSSRFRWQQIGSMETLNAEEIKAQTEEGKKNMEKALRESSGQVYRQTQSRIELIQAHTQKITKTHGCSPGNETKNKNSEETKIIKTTTKNAHQKPVIQIQHIAYITCIYRMQLERQRRFACIKTI